MSPHPLWRHADTTAPLRSRQRAPCCCPPPVGWGRVAQLCNGFGPRRRLCSTRPFGASRARPAHLRRSHGRACTARIAQTCIVLLPPLVGRGPSRPTFVTALASDAAYAQPGLCASRAPPAHPRRRSACARASGHAPIRRRCLVPLRCPDRSASAIFCPHIAVPRTQAAKRATPNPWRLARSCMASGRAPAAQNCPRSRTRLMPCFRRLLGAANAARASEAGGWEHKLGSARPSRNLRVGTRPGIERRHRVFRSRDAGARFSRGRVFRVSTRRLT